MGTSRIELTARWRWLPSSELQVGAPPWGLTKADRAENSKTRLKQLALWLFVVVLIVVWFRVNKLWNIFLLFTAILEGASTKYETRKHAEVLDARNISKKRRKRVNYAFRVVSIDDDDSNDHHHHRHHLVFSSLLWLFCVNQLWLAIFLDKFRNVGHDNN